MNWFSVKDKMPPVDTQILVCYKYIGYNKMPFGAFVDSAVWYDGTKLTEECSQICFSYDDCDSFYEEWQYNEEEDDYYVGKGWYGYNDLIESISHLDERYTVTHWAYMPEPPIED